MRHMVFLGKVLGCVFVAAGVPATVAFVAYTPLDTLTHIGFWMRGIGLTGLSLVGGFAAGALFRRAYKQWEQAGNP